MTMLMLGGCLTLQFEEPQPSGADVLQQFPKSFRGHYVFEDDTIEVGTNRVYYPEEYSKSIALSELEKTEELRVEDNLIYDSTLPTQEGVAFKVSNDTLRYETTLRLHYQLSDTLQLRKLGKWLIVNHKDEDDDYWDVYLLARKRKDLILYVTGNFKVDDRNTKVETEERKLSEFFAITNFRKVSNKHYILNPTKKELKALIKADFFSEQMRFRRI